MIISAKMSYHNAFFFRSLFKRFLGDVSNFHDHRSFVLRVAFQISFSLIDKKQFKHLTGSSKTDFTDWILEHFITQSKTVLDSRFYVVDSGIPGIRFQSLTVKLGFRIPFVSGIPIPPKKLSWNPDSGFRIPL